MAASIVDLPDPFLEQGLGSSSAASPQPFPTALEPETAEAHSDETVPAAKVELKLRVLPSCKHQQPTYKHYKCEPFTTSHGAYKHAATGLDELLAVDTHGELPRPRPALASPLDAPVSWTWIRDQPLCIPLASQDDWDSQVLDLHVHCLLKELGVCRRL